MKSIEIHPPQDLPPRYCSLDDLASTDNHVVFISLLVSLSSKLSLLLN